jgi:ATP diphosphatase
MRAEDALRGANRKFTKRFAQLEKELLQQGKKFPQSLKLLDQIWNDVKRK